MFYGLSKSLKHCFCCSRFFFFFFFHESHVVTLAAKNCSRTAFRTDSPSSLPSPVFQVRDSLAHLGADFLLFLSFDSLDKWFIENRESSRFSFSISLQDNSKKQEKSQSLKNGSCCCRTHSIICLLLITTNMVMAIHECFHSFTMASTVKEPADAVFEVPLVKKLRLNRLIGIPLPLVTIPLLWCIMNSRIRKPLPSSSAVLQILTEMSEYMFSKG